MKKMLFVFFMIVAVHLGTMYGQVPLPVNIDVGAGGGVSLPVGDLGNGVNSGYHAGAKVKISGFMPLNLVGSGIYNRLADKVGSDATTITSITLGLEYTIPSLVIKPYLGADMMMNIMGSTASGSSTITRYGAGFGGGVSFPIPGMGGIDASVKYQMLNLIGKESNEISSSQVTATVMFMFSVL